MDPKEEAREASAENGKRQKAGSRRSRSRSKSPHHRRRRRSRSRSWTRSRSKSYSPRRRRRSFSCSRSRSRSPRYRRSYSRSRSPAPRGGSRRNQGDRSKPEKCDCIGIFGLSLRTTERDLRDLFSEFGRLKDVQMVCDRYTGRSRGFAFVYFDDVNDAEEAMLATNGTQVDGRNVRVDYSITRRAHTPTPGVYMGRPTRSHRKRWGRSRSRSCSPYRRRSRSRSPNYRRSRSPYRRRSRSPYYRRSRSYSRSPSPFYRRRSPSPRRRRRSRSRSPR